MTNNGSPSCGDDFHQSGSLLHGQTTGSIRRTSEDWQALETCLRTDGLLLVVCYQSAIKTVLVIVTHMWRVLAKLVKIGYIYICDRIYQWAVYTQIEN